MNGQIPYESQGGPLGLKGLYVLKTLFYFALFLFRDFDALLYLCEGGFQYLPLATFTELTDGVVFPVFVVSGVSLLLALLFSYFQKLRYFSFTQSTY